MGIIETPTGGCSTLLCAAGGCEQIWFRAAVAVRWRGDGMRGRKTDEGDWRGDTSCGGTSASVFILSPLRLDRHLNEEPSEAPLVGAVRTFSLKRSGCWSNLLLFIGSGDASQRHSDTCGCYKSPRVTSHYKYIEPVEPEETRKINPGYFIWKQET